MFMLTNRVTKFFREVSFIEPQILTAACDLRRSQTEPERGPLTERAAEDRGGTPKLYATHITGAMTNGIRR